MIKNKSSSSRKNETGKDKQSDLGMNVSLPMEEPEIERTIEITIDSIENISSIQTIRKEGVDQILLRVEHNEILLGESPSIKLDNNYERECDSSIKIDYTVLFTIIVNKHSSIGAVVSTPILITALESFANNSDSGNGSAGDGLGKNNKETRSSATRIKNLKKNQTPIIMGICNFDIIPLMLGEKIVREKLLLEAVPSFHGKGIISWENLPRLTVSAKFTIIDENIFPTNNIQGFNFLTITLESIYNLPSSFTDDSDYKASTVVYERNEVPNDVIFDGGFKTNIPDIEKTKHWQSLHLIEGRAKLSKYKLNTEITKNDVEDDINLSDNVARVQWNSMQRFLILHSGCETMLNVINRYKYWPFFLVVQNPAGKSKDLTNKQKAKDADNTMMLFQTYIDVSELLFPGTTRTRRVAKLHTFSTSVMGEKTGIDKCVFEKDILTKATKEIKESKKGKSPNKGSSLPVTTVESMEPEYVQSFPLTTENGKPVFVIIEFELHHPLQPARTLEDLTDCIDKMIHPYIAIPNPYTSDLAEEHYSNCIRKLVDILCRAFQDFKQSCSSTTKPIHDSNIMKNFVKNENSNSNIGKTNCKESINDEEDSCSYTYIKDEIECFIQYLHETGTYSSVRSTLKNKITLLLDQKLKFKTPTLSTKEFQNFVAPTYIHLVEQMHSVLNKFVEGQYSDEVINSNEIHISSSFFAEESWTLGYTQDARKEYLDMIVKDKKNPDTWIEYGIYLIRIKDMERATECCREAIALNTKHKIALLIYGLILSGKEAYHDAEIFFQTVVRLYPRFGEGWAILHLFYLRIKYFPGADVTFEIAKKCIKDKNPDTITMEFLKREPLLWTTLNYPKDRIYLWSGVLLMKLSFFDFAGIALAQELAEMGRTRYLLYYLAVQHYIENRYEDAICHLKEAIGIHGMEYSIASLMGHCHMEKGNFEEAIYFYEFANSSFDRPEDLHLVQLRLGNLYLNTNRYEDAKKMFLIVCKNSPTYRSWLGVGIACYHLNDMKNAEKSLTEANSLNTQDPEVWGYLCLLNMSLQRYHEFLQCYRQVVKQAMYMDLLMLLFYLFAILFLSSTILEQSYECANMDNDKRPDEQSRLYDAN